MSYDPFASYDAWKLRAPEDDRPDPPHAECDAELDAAHKQLAEVEQLNQEMLEGLHIALGWIRGYTRRDSPQASADIRAQLETLIAKVEGYEP